MTSGLSIERPLGSDPIVLCQILSSFVYVKAGTGDLQGWPDNCTVGWNHFATIVWCSARTTMARVTKAIGVRRNFCVCADITCTCETWVLSLWVFPCSSSLVPVSCAGLEEKQWWRWLAAGIGFVASIQCSNFGPAFLRAVPTVQNYKKKDDWKDRVIAMSPSRQLLEDATQRCSQKDVPACEHRNR